MVPTIISCLAIAGSVVYAQDEAPTVTIDNGAIRGRTTHVPNVPASVNQFLGIPFAEPPVDDLRFATPRPASLWTDTLNATEQPPACLQYLGKPGPARDLRNLLFNNPPVARESEDCLYLNVYTPQGGDENKAVMFWIHGGSNIMGSAALPLYDGTEIAAKHDVIVVAPNYRLNLFGNPRGSPIPVEEAALSQLDINLALNWTAENIQHFGGDPAKVTIAGESAGAVAVGNIVNTFQTSPPFRAAIEMSGSSVVRALSINDDDPDKAWPDLLEHLNCTDTSGDASVECVRAVPAETLQQILGDNELPFGTQPDNNVTSLEHPDRAWAEKNVAQVPLLIGSTADDGSYFVREPAIQAERLGLSMSASLKILGLPDQAVDTLSAFYEPGSENATAAGINSTSQAFTALATDITFGCTSAFVANITANVLDNVPVWQYLFDAEVPSNTFPEYPELGVWHSSELSLLFGTYTRENATEVDVRLSTSTQKQFADFVKDPTHGPGWEKWPQVAVLGVSDGQPITITRDVRELMPVCEAYNRLWLSGEVSALAAVLAGKAADSGSGSSDSDQESMAVKSSASVVAGLAVVMAALLSY